MKQKYCAGIVTYNPNILLLKRNLEAIIYQVSEIVIVDNGSYNREVIHTLVSSYSNITFLPLKENKGIAYALNCIAKFAFVKSYSWFLTLDQDSVCPPNIISVYDQYTNNDNIGVICPYISLRINDLESSDMDNATEFVDVAITSGCLVRYDAYFKARGFWNFLFIDKVDDDFCYSIRNQGYLILRVNGVVLNHQIGDPSVKSFLNFSFYTDSYSSFRYYYIARNTIIVYSLQGKNRMLVVSLVKRFIKILLGEKRKIEKLKEFCRGVNDGINWIVRRRIEIRDNNVDEL